ncbi:hypothetical protein [Streptomyces sp. NPDC048385]|uniref:hypothetical protein n=1 Tax=Streptomyces sp. NPDC048385 TaxID=3155145 RepID=UPI003413CBEC
MQVEPVAIWPESAQAGVEILGESEQGASVLSRVEFVAAFTRFSEFQHSTSRTSNGCRGPTRR